MLDSKFCRMCGTHKAMDEFYRNKANRDGVSAYCKPCWRDYMAPRDKERHRTNPRRRSYQKHNLERWQFEAMWVAQGGLCWLCKGNRSGKSLCIDHDHMTGEVRKLLCRQCNSALGCAKDDPEILRSALRYLAGTSIPD